MSSSGILHQCLFYLSWMYFEKSLNCTLLLVSSNSVTFCLIIHFFEVKGCLRWFLWTGKECTIFFLNPKKLDLYQATDFRHFKGVVKARFPDINEASTQSPGFWNEMYAFWNWIVYIYIRFNRTFGNRLESVDGTERCCQHSRCALVSHHMPSKKDQRSIWSEQVCMAVILNHTPHPPWSKRIIEADISHDQECFWIGNSRCSCYAGKICQKRISFRSLGMGTPRCETSYCAPKRKDSGVLGGRTSLVGRESTGSWQAGFSCNNRRHKPQPVLAF